MSKSSKRIECRVELVANYIWSILASADLWDTKTLQNIPAYPKRDLDFLYKQKELIIWGNGRGGALTNLLFFYPLSERELSHKEYSDLLKSIKTGLTEESPEILNKLGFSNLSREGFEKIRPDLIEIFDIFQRNLTVYQKEVWEFHKGDLLAKKAEMDILLNQDDMISKWEDFLGLEFPADMFEIILTFDNTKMPSANNLSRTRYNFYFKDNLENFLQHEIGTNLLGEAKNSLYTDEEMKTEFIQNNNVIWLAFESLAEYIKGILFNKRDEWKGEMFGGGEFNFAWFFKYYEENLTIPLNKSLKQILKDAVLEYQIAIVH